MGDYIRDVDRCYKGISIQYSHLWSANSRFELVYTKLCNSTDTRNAKILRFITRFKFRRKVSIICYRSK